MLSGWETNNGYDFRGTVLGIPQSWFCVMNGGSGDVNVTVAIGVLPADYNPTAADLIDGSLKEYPWMYYRRVLLPIAAALQAVGVGLTSFDTNTRARRKLRQGSESLRLIIGNNGDDTISYSHWSNIPLSS